MADEQWQAAIDYIELLESCQDGYYRASESDEAKRWRTLRAAPTPPAAPPADLVANALRSLNALEGLARAYAYETNAFDNSGTFAECVRAALVAPGAPSALNHWRDMFESKLAEAIRQGDPMVKFSLTPNQMRDIAAALAAPVGETPAHVNALRLIAKVARNEHGDPAQDCIDIIEGITREALAGETPARDQFDSQGRHTDADAARGEAHPVGCRCDWCAPGETPAPCPNCAGEGTSEANGECWLCKGAGVAGETPAPEGT